MDPTDSEKELEAFFKSLPPVQPPPPLSVGQAFNVEDVPFGEIDFGVENLDGNANEGAAGNANEGAAGAGGNANEGPAGAGGNANPGAAGAGGNAAEQEVDPLDLDNLLDGYQTDDMVIDEILIDDIEPVSNAFGAVVREGARLPIVPPLAQPPPLLPGQLPAPRIMPSRVNFALALQSIQHDALQLSNGQGNNQELLQRINTSLATMHASFQGLSQITTTTSRHPRTGDSLIDYLCLTREQVLDHANITLNVFRTRFRASPYQDVGWPRPGDQTTMPIMVFYRDNFHALMYSRRQITFARLRREVASVCNTVVGEFLMMYNNGIRYTPLGGEAEWGVCNEFYDNAGLFRLELLVAANN